MSKVTLRKQQGSSKAQFISIEIRANGDVYVSRWKDGARNAAGTNFPVASFAPLTSEQRRDAIVTEEAANGFVLQATDTVMEVTVYSFVLTTALDAMPHVLQVFEAFGISMPDPQSTAQQDVVGSEFVIKRTINDIRVTAALQCDAADAKQARELHRHLAIARCLSIDAEVFENTNAKIDPLDMLRRARNGLDEAILEPLYRFGVMRRPMDLTREFTEASPTPFAVGF
jgi:hypothetical protein